ncbi:MAG TPA: hypothetical protein VER76_20660 [Pyrinomonadaceae bacterium]|nr:hypothetical protein [Pyrinomonadaceae bacterium]
MIAQGGRKVEKISYLGLPNCYRLLNGAVEAVVTSDVGPRIIRYSFSGAENILGEVPGATLQTELGDFKPWGGHRLWVAPEAKPRSYAPDNAPLAVEFEGERAIRLTARAHASVGIEREMRVALDAEGSLLSVHHKITNRNLWAIEAAPWALTIMRGGGTAIFPQEPYISWDDYLLPARPLVLWHYTDLTDARWHIGKKFIRLTTDATANHPQKIGMLNKQGWAAYRHGATLFVKRFAYEEGANYPDYGCNCETYTAGDFIEVESLAPLRRLEPGESAQHEERWSLFQGVETGATEAELEAALGSLPERLEKLS